jgi:hypothetical protein
MIGRPSWLITKSAHILGWFEKYRKAPAADQKAAG